MEKVPEAESDSWMGHSVGRWEGDTLVIDVTGLNDRSWFDRPAIFTAINSMWSNAIRPSSRDALRYEATIEDPLAFSRPWKISMPLYRHIEKGAQFTDFKCVEFVIP
jgi:hypothetical protein